MAKSVPVVPQQPREQLLLAWPEIFPGIDRVVVLFMTSSGETGGNELIFSGNRYRTRELLLNGFEESIKQQSKDQSGYSWLSNQQIPFEQSNYQSGQRELFAEQQHVILQLRLKSPVSKAVDLFYLFFREDQSNFGINRLEGYFDTSRKALVGNLMLKFTHFYYSSMDSMQEYISLFTNVTREIIRGNRQEDTASHKLSAWVGQWADSVIAKLTETYDIKIKVPEQSISKLMIINDFIAAKTSLENAVQFAIMLHAGSGKEEIVLEPDFYYCQ
jgi:hypothetical protein